jgi:phosphoribosyl-ATP pyrophosphohydrolase
LHQLQALIDDRRQTLPEGSYTTHLFNKGAEKIRKKTGEEAVELILARSKEEMIYEAADLIYHLMVLLSAEGLSIDEVLAELARRHG